MPALIIHGGAGRARTLAGQEAIRASLAHIAATAWAMVLDGTQAVDIAIEAARLLEDDPLFNAGLGSKLQSDGAARLSAALMDGARERLKHAQAFGLQILTFIDEHDRKARSDPGADLRLLQQQSGCLADAIKLAIRCRRDGERDCQPSPPAVNPPRKCVDRAAFHTPAQIGDGTQPLGQAPPRPVHEGEREHALSVVERVCFEPFGQQLHQPVGLAAPRAAFDGLDGHGVKTLIAGWSWSATKRGLPIPWATSVMLSKSDRALAQHASFAPIAPAIAS